MAPTSAYDPAGAYPIAKHLVITRRSVYRMLGTETRACEAGTLAVQGRTLLIFTKY